MTVPRANRPQCGNTFLTIAAVQDARCYAEALLSIRGFSTHDAVYWSYNATKCT